MRTFGPNQGLLEGRVLAQGTVKGLTILVNFQDVTSTITRADVEAMLNGENYTRNGNMCSVTRVLPPGLERQARLHQRCGRARSRSARNRQFYVQNLLVEEALNLAVAGRSGP